MEDINLENLDNEMLVELLEMLEGIKDEMGEEDNE